MYDLSNDTIIHCKKNGYEYIQFRRLLEYQNIIKHAFTLKANDLDFGIHNDRSKYTSIVVENYKNICDCLDIDYRNIVRPIQTHTNIVKRMDYKEYSDRPDMYINYLENVDGIVTDKNNIVLSTNSGDCVLMFFFDPKKKVIANVHSGWRGTMKKIAKYAVKKMREEYNCNPQDIIVCINPCIRKCHFEVEEDVKKMFEKSFSYTNRLNDIIEKGNQNGKYHVDIVLINKILLQDCGLKEENIVDSGLCSTCNKDLIYSYRGDKNGMGRSTGLIELVV
jgi:YfiH family protein